MAISGNGEKYNNGNQWPSIMTMKKEKYQKNKRIKTCINECVCISSNDNGNVACMAWPSSCVFNLWLCGVYQYLKRIWRININGQWKRINGTEKQPMKAAKWRRSEMVTVMRKYQPASESLWHGQCESVARINQWPASMCINHY